MNLFETKSYAEIEEFVLNELDSDPGKEKLQKRREKIAEVAEALAERARKNPDDEQSHKRSFSLKKRKGIWFTVNQSKTINATPQTYTLNVELLGTNIGTLEVNIQANSKLLFYPDQKKTSVKEYWEWSGNRVDGIAIGEYIKKQIEILEKKPIQERVIQWQLANQMNTNKASCKNLAHLRTISWLGYPSEVGVSVTREGKLGTGNIDLLVRRSGGNQGGQFLVFELKRPNEDDVESALKQAIAYAIALHREANLKKETRQAYRTAFGPLEPKGIAKLNFGAVIVMEDTCKNREAGEMLLKKYTPQPKSNQHPVVDRLGMLLYDWNAKGQKATNWTWIDGWDPRKPQNQ